MKKEDVLVGTAYVVKIGEKMVAVKILHEHLRGGWVGRNMTTGREIHIRSAQKLRGPLVERVLPNPVATR